MPVTNTQDVFKIRSIDTVHVNPSILEGTKLYKSVIGSDRAVAIERFPAEFLVDPTIVGSHVIPSILSCVPGVIKSSPQAQITYQWKSDGDDIDGQTSNTLLTYDDLHDTTITCEVTATNSIYGAVDAISNGITVESIYPIENNEHIVFSMTGLSQKNQQNINLMYHIMITGMWSDTRFDIEEMLILPITGMWVDHRFDTMALSDYIITGLNSTDKVDGNENTSNVITGLQATQQLTLFENEIYTTWYPKYFADLTVLNPDASDGINHWIIESGDFNIETLDRATYQGVTVTWDVFTGRITLSNSLWIDIVYQDIDMPANFYSHIDSENGYLEGKWKQGGNESSVNISFECFDENDVSLGPKSYLSTFSKMKQVGGRRVIDPVVTDKKPILPLTRYIRVRLEFNKNQSGFDLDSFLTDISLSLWEDSR